MWKLSNEAEDRVSQVIQYCNMMLRYVQYVDLGGPVVIMLASGSEVRGFEPGRGRLIFSERKNLEYDFLRKGSKAMGPVSLIYGT